MQKAFLILFVFLLFIPCCTYALELSATSAVLYEPVSKRVIFEKNIHQKMSMASTTKIASGITAIEYGNLKDIVTVSKNAADTEGSSVWLEAGEKMTLEELLYGMMLSSGNDAAVAIAEHVSGNVEKFAELMNDVAFKAGASNTNFTNPSGLDHENHYTTAIDLAKITAYALENSLFAEIVSTNEKTIPWEGHEWNRKLSNHNKLLKMYDGCTGVKTGFTKKSGRCLVSSATKNGVSLIAVTLKAPDDWNDHIKMLDYGFSVLNDKVVVEEGSVQKEITVANGVFDKVDCIATETFRVPQLSTDLIETEVNIKKGIEAPFDEGTVVGYIDVMLNGEKVKRVDIKTAVGCEKKFVPTWSYYAKMLFEFMFKSKNDISLLNI